MDDMTDDPGERPEAVRPWAPSPSTDDALGLGEVLGASEVLGSAPITTLAPSHARPRRRRLAVVAGGVAGVLVVAGAASAFAYSALAAKGSDPESVVPASAIAFLKVDLDPPAGEKVALLRVLRSLPDGATTGDDLSTLVADQLAKSSNGEVKADQLRSWLGKRFAVVVMTDGSKTPYPVVIAATTDQDATRATLRGLKDHTVVGFNDGYALITDTQAHLDSYDKALASGTLQSDPAFSKLRAALGGDQVALAWSDLTRASAAVNSAMSSFSQRFNSLQLDAPNGSSEPTLKLDPATGQITSAALRTSGTTTPTMTAQGQIILGLHAHDNGMELSGLYDGPTVSPLTASSGVVAHLPADTSVALGVSGVGTAVRKQLDTLPASYRSMINTVLSQAGITLDDVTSLASKDLAFATAGDISGSQMPASAIVAQTTEPARGLGTAKALLALGETPFAYTATGPAPGSDAVFVASTPTWGAAVEAAEARSGAGLGAEPLFREAVAYPDAPIVAYVDMARAFPHVDTPVAAVGVSVGHQDSYESFSVRVVLR